MIAIVDYGMGNLNSLKRILAALGSPSCFVRDPFQLAEAEKVILPGVGHFGKAMDSLNRSGLSAVIIDLAESGKVPILGICLGMQLLGEGSEEGGVDGLSLIKGKVVKYRVSNPNAFKIPHTGWNTCREVSKSPLLKGVPSDAEFYFVHGFRYESVSSEQLVACTTFETTFPSIVGGSHIFGTQFHPEKSHQFGAAVLKNFISHNVV